MVTTVLAKSDKTPAQLGKYAVDVDYTWGESVEKLFPSYTKALNWLLNQYGVESATIEKQVTDA